MKVNVFRYMVIIITLILSRYIPNGISIIRFLVSLGTKSIWIVIVVVIGISNIRLRLRVKRLVRELEQISNNDSSEDKSIDV